MLNKHIAARMLESLQVLRSAKNDAELAFQYGYNGGRIDQLLCAELIDSAAWGRLCALKHNAYNMRCFEIGLKAVAA